MTSNLIRVDITSVTLFDLIKRIDEGELRYKEVQHWTNSKKSLLIDSILTRIPIGTIIIDVSGWPMVIVDGKNRIDAIYWYMQDTYETGFMEFVVDASGKKFSSLKRLYQRRIEETKIFVAEMQVPNNIMKKSVISRMSGSGS